MQTIRSITYSLIIVILSSCSPASQNVDNTPTTAPEVTQTPEVPQGKEILRSYLGTPERGEVATSIIELDDGGFLVAGYDYDRHDNISEWDALVMRISPEGQEVWSHSSDKQGSEYAWVVRDAGNDQFVVVGTWESDDGDTDGYMQGFDANGNELWFRTYGGDGEEILWAAESTPDGGFLLAGQTDSEGAGGLDFYMVRTDADGNELWSKTFGTLVTDRALGIGVSPDGGALIVGFTGAIKNTMDIFYVRTDKDGRELWKHTLAGSRFDVAHDVLTLPDGGFVISGYTSSFTPGDHDGLLMRLSADGRLLWMKTYGDTRDDRILHVAQLEDGGFAMVDYSSRDMTVWRLDIDGDLVWSYGDLPNQVSRGKDIIVAKNGSIVAVGGSPHSTPQNEDIFLLVLGEQ
ncbi:MAG TPA: hypothetical protein VLA72_20480 [Anaerolineales bacterium]|nr:hypothetical protein [Anaerolineales bacterium]